jgi:hypothetical protein
MQLPVQTQCLVAKDVTIYYFQTMTGIITGVLEMFNELF